MLNFEIPFCLDSASERAHGRVVSLWACWSGHSPDRNLSEGIHVHDTNMMLVRAPQSLSSYADDLMHI